MKANLALSIIESESKNDVQERIDWWLENGGDELSFAILLRFISSLTCFSLSVFVIEASDPEVPDGLISIIKLLKLDATQWESVRAKNKPPKPSLDEPSARAVIQVLERRLTEYRNPGLEVRTPFALPTSTIDLAYSFGPVSVSNSTAG